MAIERVRRPLIEEIREAILDELIVSGAISPGERLPTEAQLCERYGVSRVTVRTALRSLQEAGYISIRQGQGSTVLPRPEAIASGLDQLSSFETFAAQQGEAVLSTDVVLEEVVLDQSSADRLDVAVGSPAWKVSRTKVHDGVKVGWIVDYVPSGVIPLSTLQDEFQGSVLDLLLAHAEIGVDHADTELVPVALTRPQAQRLDVRTGAPALYFDEITCTADGRIVNWCQAWLLPGHFRFVLRRR